MFAAFTQVRPRVPEPGESTGELEIFSGTVRARSFQCEAQVIVLILEPSCPRLLLLDPRCKPKLGQPGEKIEVPQPYFFRLTTFDQPVTSELTYGLEHSISCRPR